MAIYAIDTRVFSLNASGISEYNQNDIALRVSLTLLDVVDSSKGGEYIVSDDGKQHVFKLGDFKFENGVPVTAQHYLNALYSLRKNKSPYILSLKDVVGYESFIKNGDFVGFELLSSTCFKLKLKWPNYRLIQELNSSSIRPLYKNNHLLSAGEYRVDYMCPNGEEIRLSKNPYWSENLEQIKYLYYSDIEKALTDFKSKNIDFLPKKTYFPNLVNSDRVTRLVEDYDVSISIQFVGNSKKDWKNKINSRKIIRDILSSLNFSAFTEYCYSTINYELFSLDNYSNKGTSLDFEKKSEKNAEIDFINSIKRPIYNFHKDIISDDVVFGYWDFPPNLFLVNKIKRELNKFGFNIKIKKLDFYNIDTDGCDLVLNLSLGNQKWLFPFIQNFLKLSYPLMNRANHIDISTLELNHKASKDLNDYIKIERSIFHYLYDAGFVIPILSVPNLK